MHASAMERASFSTKRKLFYKVAYQLIKRAAGAMDVDMPDCYRIASVNTSARR